MTHHGNHPRPVRTLTVKNFSVIKDAKLEFGKITVLIGPQSSGKSLLCKLAYFLSNELIEIAATSVAGSRNWDHFLAFLPTEFQSRFYMTPGIVTHATVVAFTSDAYEVSLCWTPAASNPDFKFSKAFQQAYNIALDKRSEVARSVSGLLLSDGNSAGTRIHEALFELNSVIWSSKPLASVYIPANRVFFSNLSKQAEVLKNVGLDTITRDFAGQLVWDGLWKAGLLTTGRGVTDEINRQMTEILGGFVISESGIPRFLTKGGVGLPLEVASTGTQEMIPLFNVIERLAYLREHLVETSRTGDGPSSAELIPISRPLLYLEEPEANVFPSTQYDLVKLFAWLTADPVLDFSFVITTHSPYILSSFNNLIEAGQAAHNNPKLRSKIAKIVPEKYWIKEGDFAAYSIEDGKLKSILNKSGFVEANYLDQVSEVIGDEFDKLLRLEYERAKVS
jgi:hypothetical protein